MEQELARANAEAVRLVQQFLKGQSRAFPALVNLFTPRVMSIIRRLVSSYHDAEDLHNEIWLKVAQNLHKYDPTLPFHSWLYRIASNACIDFLRKRREIALEDEQLHQHVHKRPSGPVKSPELFLLEKESYSELTALLDCLPETDRLILTLRFVQEMSYDEIGSIVGMSKNTVGTRLFRARKQLKEQLDKYREERRMSDAAY
ncbi:MULTISPECIES: RNA polymerase sigma factor [Brevibacillus]|jgi:RNA polymerase sigma-70 factor (ECF subfamily)|uniref:RNA polymerase sigma factor SigW n=1 Tax=Brevibacillus borstelensis AK1 TaxID=1300222 RepID=M8DA15_9BACL|nr:sigma-70 family RNA polymerase sigma factor [Brevibacillus borstelensis]EMT50137.1 RNA polymerase sigma factor SigW [Brevibacillus borstelensis AK1]KKX53357.1 RNA polymerase subunit sigma-24 [Brevibacillus borstelensis cifa_chp40]MBE5394201.1 sigma-70 family RNA polymerase sigma factor [Brevibacillus borstelensis]MCC0566163.1 sigma-70 family RNA polymerase sigma factor [Brevibacillus borstelensis]MCM3472476.1 sigma-70 family RNA polymerase sigma factor [Brevibacillus borstelensis]